MSGLRSGQIIISLIVPFAKSNPAISDHLTFGLFCNISPSTKATSFLSIPFTLGSVSSSDEFPPPVFSFCFKLFPFLFIFLFSFIDFGGINFLKVVLSFNTSSSSFSSIFGSSFCLFSSGLLIFFLFPNSEADLKLTNED